VAARLLLYFTATGHSLYCWRRAGPQLEQHFSADEAGLGRFLGHLKERRGAVLQIVADLGGEDFHEDQIPYLRGAERRAVIERRLAQRHRDTRIAAALSLGHAADERRSERLLLASFNDARPLVAWLEAIGKARAVVAAVHSTALLAPALAAGLGVKNERLFVMTANRAGLRQSFVENGRLRFSRLERIEDRGAGLTSVMVRTETERMLKYLDTLRSLPVGTPPMRVILVVSNSERTHFERTLGSGGGLAFTTIGFAEAARRVGLRRWPEGSGAELLYLQLAALRPPSEQFLRGEDRRSFLGWRLRRSIVGAGVAGFVTCGAYAATLWLEQLVVRERVEGVRLDSALAREQIARVRARLPAAIESVKASAVEFRRLAARNASPEAALEHVSRALEQSPRIELDALAWSAEPEPALEITGRIASAGRSDYRAIADEVQRFGALLGAGAGWRVVSTRLPFDRSSDGLLTAGSSADSTETPRFAMRIARSPG
jgi:hypothetical protein